MKYRMRCNEKTHVRSLQTTVPTVYRGFRISLAFSNLSRVFASRAFLNLSQFFETLALSILPRVYGSLSSSQFAIASSIRFHPAAPRIWAIGSAMAETSTTTKDVSDNEEDKDGDEDRNVGVKESYSLGVADALPSSSSQFVRGRWRSSRS